MTVCLHCSPSRITSTTEGAAVEKGRDSQLFSAGVVGTSKVRPTRLPNLISIKNVRFSSACELQRLYNMNTFTVNLK